MPPEIKNDYKIFAISAPKIIRMKNAEGGEDIFLEGYANSKGVKDRYGDVPTCYKRDFVYKLDNYSKNPVTLIDHVNQVDHIAGSMESLKEDGKGLFFRHKFSNSDLPLIKHARTVYCEGHGKAISICGRFYHENEEAPEQLTLADIHEISLVGVGTDPNALGEVVSKAMKAFKDNPAATDSRLSEIFKVLQNLEEGKSLSDDELLLIRPFADELREKVFGTKEVYDPKVIARKLSEL